MGMVKELLSNNIDEAATKIAKLTKQDVYDELWHIWEEYDVFETDEFVNKFNELHNGETYEIE